MLRSFIAGRMTTFSGKFIDIGVNLTDPVFRGIHRGKRKHDGDRNISAFAGLAIEHITDDFDLVLQRARSAGVSSMIITGGSLTESQEALELAEKHKLYATVGCHPTRSSEFEQFASGPEDYLNALSDVLANAKRAVAVGECGLDYDRLSFAPAEVQKTHFRSQLSLAKKYHLPLFLHSRAAHSDFVSILREEGFGEAGGRAVGGAGGVVHSFTGKKEEMEELVKMGFHIGVNGCSMKTEENVEVCRAIPIDRLLLETDAPWCSMTSTHASRKHLDGMPAHLRDLFFPPATKAEGFVPGKAVKGRNEPCAVGGVAWALFCIRNGESPSFEEMVERCWQNTVDLFQLDPATLMS